MNRNRARRDPVAAGIKVCSNLGDLAIRAHALDDVLAELGRAHTRAVAVAGQTNVERGGCLFDAATCAAREARDVAGSDIARRRGWCRGRGGASGCAGTSGCVGLGFTLRGYSVGLGAECRRKALALGVDIREAFVDILLTVLARTIDDIAAELGRAQARLGTGIVGTDIKGLGGSIEASTGARRETRNGSDVHTAGS